MARTIASRCNVSGAWRADDDRSEAMRAAEGAAVTSDNRTVSEPSSEEAGRVAEIRLRNALGRTIPVMEQAAQALANAGQQELADRVQGWAEATAALASLAKRLDVDSPTIYTRTCRMCEEVYYTLLPTGEICPAGCHSRPRGKRGGRQVQARRLAQRVEVPLTGLGTPVQTQTNV